MPSGVMLSQLAERLVFRGHSVTVYTMFPSLPEGKVFPGFQRRLWRAFHKNGMIVVRCFAFVYGRDRRPIWRVLSHLSFAITTIARLLLDSKPDILVVEAQPVISSPWLVALAKLLRVPVVNYIKDMYPEVLEDAKMIQSDGLVATVARGVDRLTCLVADVNLVLSDSFRDVLVKSRGIPAGRISVIRDWIDGAHISPGRRGDEWRKEHEIPNSSFVAMFAGTLGIASGAEVIVLAAQELKKRGRDDILILCIGEGVLKASMEEQAQKLDLSNLRFLPFQPQDRIGEVQSAANVMLLTMSARHAFSSVPSKLITYMAVGRPILCSSDPESQIAKLVTDAAIGLVIPPGDPIALAEALIQMSFDRDGLVEKGNRARLYFESHHDMPTALDRFEALLTQSVEIFRQDP